ncbi:MAG: hypothetical protein H7338_10095 [Candidatus Sericytochromatia bacterium]|nr:hypothetical protein [Candidatus Sericytochromatia bacterium]
MGNFDRLGPAMTPPIQPDSTVRPALRPLLQPSIDATDQRATMAPSAITVSPAGRAISRVALSDSTRTSGLPGNALAGLSTSPATRPAWLHLPLTAVGQANRQAVPAPTPLVRWSSTTQPAAPVIGAPSAQPVARWSFLTAASRSAGVGMAQTVRPAGAGLSGLPPRQASSLSGLPPRQANSLTGSGFIASTQGMSRPEREAAIFQQIAQGNVPDFMRHFQTVTTHVTAPDGTRHTGTFSVLPDYLAIGSDQDFVRMPMSPLTAQRVADLTGCTLPTRKMVDAVYAGAQVQLKPQPQPAGDRMMSNAYVQQHQQMIEGQRAGQPLGALTAGHKKDVVLSNQLRAHPDKVAIYGWHQPSGKAIQPLSTIHENTYADYSHGARLVSPMMKVDGRMRKVADIMRSPTLCGLLSDEGPMQVTRIPGT